MSRTTSFCRRAFACRTVLLVLAAGALVVIAPFAHPAPALAQGTGPENIKPVEGEGTVIAAGTWAGAFPYSGTMSGKFTPSRIHPGQGFVYESNMHIDDSVDFSGQPCRDEVGAEWAWGYSRVSPGGNLWTSLIEGSTSLLGPLNTHSCEGGEFVEIKHTVAGTATNDMQPGCYQSLNWNSFIWFPGETNSGTIATLVVYDEAGGSWPTCGVADTSAKLEVKKTLSPAGDPGRFDLLIDNNIEKQDAGDGGTTGPKTVTAGNHLVTEVAGTPGTSLANYASSAVCRDRASNVEVKRGTGPGPLTVPVNAGDDVVCTITNTRKDRSVCSDGLDNDADGLVDFGSGAGNDRGCLSSDDSSEIDADVRVEKRFVGTEPTLVGSLAVFTVEVVNDGPQAATSVAVQDTPDARLLPFSVSTSRGLCQKTLVSVSCSLGTLGPGQSARLGLAFRVLDGEGASVGNRAVAVSTTFDPDTANNASAARVAVDYPPPNAVDDRFTVDPTRPARQLKVLRNDTPKGRVHVVGVEPSRTPLGATVSTDGTSVRYTPPRSAGDDVFSYTIADSKGRTDTATVRVKLRGCAKVATRFDATTGANQLLLGLSGKTGFCFDGSTTNGLASTLDPRTSFISELPVGITFQWKRPLVNFPAGARGWEFSGEGQMCIDPIGMGDFLRSVDKHILKGFLKGITQAGLGYIADQLGGMIDELLDIKDGLRPKLCRTIFRPEISVFYEADGTYIVVMNAPSLPVDQAVTKVTGAREEFHTTKRRRALTVLYTCDAWDGCVLTSSHSHGGPPSDF